MSVHQLLGARGNVESASAFLAEVQNTNGEVLVLNADKVCGRDHIESALLHARRAFQYGLNSADTLAMEVMLYASGERQLTKAREKMGIFDGIERIALLYLNDAPHTDTLMYLGLERDDSVLDFSKDKASLFGINEQEMASVPTHIVQELVLENVAMVDVIKR